MTEAEWLDSVDLYALLNCPIRKASDRKLRLYAVACCWQLGRGLVSPQYRRVINAAEQFADGMLTSRDYQGVFPKMRLRTLENRTARYAAREAVSAMNWTRDDATLRQWDDWLSEAVESVWGPGQFAEHYTSETASRVAHAVAYHAIGSPNLPTAPQLARDYEEALRLEWVRSVSLFRDIFGNPFHKVKFNKKWRTDIALSLAKQMYASRGFGAMPILADALQDAGCENSDILNHCRDVSATHVRGCWVVDLVLRKE